MPVFSRPATFQSIDGSASIDAEAVIDTGSHFDLIPQTWVEELRLPILGEEDVDLADGSTTRMRIAAVWLEMLGRTRVVSAFVGSSNATPLIGASTLAAFGFGVDPQGERLIPRVFQLLTITRWPTD